MTESLTQRLAHLISRPVDQAGRERASLHVLDWFGCALLGSTAEAGQVLASYGRTMPEGPCLAIGAGTRDASSAAFVNGGFGNIFEMDDLHRASIVHPGDVVIPAALAAAERDGQDAGSFLDAVVRGYEVAARIGMATGQGHYRHWYTSATCGVYGAAAAVASLHGLDHARTVDALGQAGSQSAGLWQCRIERTHSKQLCTARAAQGGLIAADLAKLGFAGARFILEGSHGLFAAACPDAAPDKVAADPDAPWKMFETTFKPWPACRHAHAAIEAALALRDGLALDQVTRIEARTYREAVEFCDKPAPSTPDEARFSIQHCVALALLDGPPDLADFEPDAIGDARIAALRSKVVVALDEAYSEAFPERYGTGLTVHLADGSVRREEIATAKGDPENPLTPAEIEAKARTLMAAGGLRADRIARLVAACLALAEGGPVAALGNAINP